MYQLTRTEQGRLKQGIRATLAAPFVDDLEDYVWEAVFSYVKDLPLVDPLSHIRSKRLFDVINPRKSIGWSAKALQWSIAPECEFELVIQRADIFKKSRQLGYDEPLNLNTPTRVLGEALLRHWYQKVNADAEYQQVTDKRICVLLKSADRSRYAYHEARLEEYANDVFEWKWTDETRTGLQGLRKRDGFCVFRWYPNQKQLFERFQLPRDAYIFEVDVKRLPLSTTIELLLAALNNP